MTTKYCSKCKQNLDISAFSSNKASYCRACMKAYDDARTEKRKEYHINYNITHKEQISKRSKEYRDRPEIKEAIKQRYVKYKEQMTEEQKTKKKEYSKEYYYANRERECQRKQLEREQDIDKVRAKHREWYKNNKDRILQQNKNPQIRLDKIAMNRLQRFIHTRTANLDLFPFTGTQFVLYFESLFTTEMNWNNYGEYWEIDHIISKKFFKYDSIDDKDFKICWSLLNLRPLTLRENRSRPYDCSDISIEVKNTIFNQYM